jgi:hypothetical protein
VREQLLTLAFRVWRCLQEYRKFSAFSLGETSSVYKKSLAFRKVNRKECAERSSPTRAPATITAAAEPESNWRLGTL